MFLEASDDELLLREKGFWAKTPVIVICFILFWPFGLLLIYFYRKSWLSGSKLFLITVMCIALSLLGYYLTLSQKVVSNETKSIAIAFSTEKKQDKDLEKGKEVVVTKGVDGIKRVTYKVTKVDGEVVSEEKIKEKIVKKPVKQVIKVGTKEKKEEKEDTKEQNDSGANPNGQGSTPSNPSNPAPRQPRPQPAPQPQPQPAPQPAPQPQPSNNLPLKAICTDGSVSYQDNPSKPDYRGMCSGHGGIAQKLGRVP